jgi:hypothetical protein
MSKRMVGNGLHRCKRLYQVALGEACATRTRLPTASDLRLREFVQLDGSMWILKKFVDENRAAPPSLEKFAQ